MIIRRSIYALLFSFCRRYSAWAAKALSSRSLWEREAQLEAHPVPFVRSASPSFIHPSPSLSPLLRPSHSTYLLPTTPCCPRSRPHTVRMGSKSSGRRECKSTQGECSGCGGGRACRSARPLSSPPPSRLEPQPAHLQPRHPLARAHQPRLGCRQLSGVYCLWQ